MADRRIRIQVDSDEDVNLDKTARGLEGVADDADRADVALRRMSKGHQVLSDEIRKTETSVKSLRDEFKRTGDVDLLKDADKLDRRLKTLKGQFTRTFEEAGQQAGGLFTSTITGAFTDLSGTAPKLLGAMASNPATLAAGVAAGVVLSAGILSVLGGGILAASAGAALAAGIAGAAQSSEVTGAWTHVLDVAQQEWRDASSVLVEPVADAIHTLGDAFSDVMPDIRADFGILAPVVDQLADGISGLIRNIQPGLTAGLQVGADILGNIADYLPALGDSISFFFEELAAGGPGLQDAFGYLLVGLTMAIDLTGILIGGAGQLFQVLEIVGEAAGGRFGEAAIHIRQLADAAGGSDEPTKRLATNLHETAAAARDSTNAFRDAQDAIDNFITGGISVDQANLRMAEGLRQLQATTSDQSRSLDEGTEAGNENSSMLLGLVRDADQVRQAQIRAHVSTEDANAGFDAQVEAIRRTSAQMGFAQGEIDALIGKYRSVPATVSTKVDAPGAIAAAEQAREAGRAVLSIPPSATSTITVTRVNRYITINGDTAEALAGTFAHGLRHGGIEYAATGTITDSPTVIFGERGTGKETYVPWAGISSQRAYELMAPTARNFGMDVVRGNSRPVPSPVSAGGGGGGNTYVLNVSVPVSAMGADVGGEIVERIKDFEQLNGPNWRN